MIRYVYLFIYFKKEEKNSSFLNVHRLSWFVETNLVSNIFYFFKKLP